MTTRAIYYYSLTGKTEAVLEGVSDIPVTKLNGIPPEKFRFGDEQVIIIGSPTYGRGAPPKYFLDILSQLRLLRGRKIGLFGSGNTIYGEDYCGALDVLEEVFKQKNDIIFKYKFEGYPTESVYRDIEKLILTA